MGTETQGAAAETVNVVQNLIAELITILPRIVGALLVLILGWILGRIVAGVVRTLADKSELDELTLATPLGRVMGGTERSVSRAMGKVAAWFVYALAFLAAADVLAIELLSQWISQAVTYLPALLGGLLVILFGFIVADFIADMIARTERQTRSRYTSLFADGVRIFLYFTVIVIGLDTMGIDVSLLYLLARGVVWGLAAATAIGLGIALGWGGKDYVSNHIEDWMRRGKERTQEMRGDSGTTGTGTGTGTEER